MVDRLKGFKVKPVKILAREFDCISPRGSNF